MCDHKIDKPIGSALEHGKAHNENHKKWSRRSFLTSLGLATAGSGFIGNLPLTSSPLVAALANGDSDRIIVMIQLKGGNDGLNTIVPVFDYGTYAANRPTIAIPENQLFSLTSEVGLPQNMQGMADLWNDDKLKIVQGVGYEGQNLSHFRSTEIWSTASDPNDDLATGWLGRFADSIYPDLLENPPDTPPAVQIGGTGNLTFQGNAVNVAVSMANTDRLEQLIESGSLYSLDGLPDDCYGQELSFMRSITNSTFFYAENIKEAYDASSNDVDYEDNDFARKMALIARLIKGNLGTRMFLVTLGGFDTHADQLFTQPERLEMLSSAMKDFYDDLGSVGDDVLGMTFSEFGRRVEQNASNGTDHGSGAPVMLFGNGVNGKGTVGDHPSLTDLDAVGNLQTNYDFRQLYATVLEHWMCVDPELVDVLMGDTFERIPGMVADCISVGQNVLDDSFTDIGHRVAYQNGTALIQYNLSRSTKLEVAIFNLDGRKLSTLFSGDKAPGQHFAPINNMQMQLPTGQYIYSIQTQQGKVSGSFLLTR